VLDNVLMLAILTLAKTYNATWWWAGSLGGAGLLFLNKQDKTEMGAEILGGLFLLSTTPLVIYFLVPMLGEKAGLAGVNFHFYSLLLWGGEFAASTAAAVGFLRVGSQRLDALKEKFTVKSRLERNRKTDVRHIDNFLPREIGQFDPQKYFDESKGLFAGLDENRKPVFIQVADWILSHVLLSGRTRSGKGVAAQILLTQSIHRKEFVVVLDPKVDAWMPHTFKAAADAAGVPYVFLDLRQDAHEQINPFQGCGAQDTENMLIGAFSLAEKGEEADFYRLADRRAALECARWLEAHPGATARDAYQVNGEDWADEAAGFHAALREMAELSAVNRKSGGVDLTALEQGGGCLYVVGDMGNTRVVRMQRMLLMRLMTLAKNRDYINQTPRTITVFADEFKVHISKPFMTSLGAAAGWGLHVILAFQSLQDLADCPADLDKDAVKGSVMENCAIQLSYKIKDPETAEWLAQSTGTILVDDESRKVEKNVALSETMNNERTIRQSERYFVDTNMFLKLPKGCGVLDGVGQLAQFCYTSPVPTARSQAAITPTVPPLPASTQPPMQGGQAAPAKRGGRSIPAPSQSAAADLIDI